jgi:hypothetical protein
MWLGVVETGLLPCFLMELLVATPILFAFRRYKWGWLNSWTAGAGGFLAGLIGAGLTTRYAFGDSTASSLLMFSVWGGLLGLATALVFRLIAMRTDALGSGSVTES